MDKLEVSVIRAEEAKRLIESPMFSQAFDDTREALLEAWAGLDNPNSDHAKDLHRMVKCLEKVRKCMEEHIQTGKIAQKEIEGRKRLFGLRRA